MTLKIIHSNLDYQVSLKRIDGTLVLDLTVEDTQDNYSYFCEHHAQYGYRTKTALIADATKKSLHEISQYFEDSQPGVSPESGTFYVQTKSEHRVQAVEAEASLDLNEAVRRSSATRNDLLVTLVGAGFVQDTGNRIYSYGSTYAVARPVVSFKAPAKMRYSDVLGWQPVGSRPLRLLNLASYIDSARKMLSEDPVWASDLAAYKSEFQSLLFAGLKS